VRDKSRPLCNWRTQRKWSFFIDIRLIQSKDFNHVAVFAVDFNVINNFCNPGVLTSEMAHSKSPSRPMGGSQMIGTESTSARGEVAKQVNQGLSDFNRQYPDSQVCILPQNPNDVDSNYFIFRLGYRTIHRVALLENFLDRYMEHADYAVRIAHEQLGSDGRVVVFLDVGKGQHKQEKHGSGMSSSLVAVVILLICLVLAYGFRTIGLTPPGSE
jgi:hypothetical protein